MVRRGSAATNAMAAARATAEANTMPHGSSANKQSKSSHTPQPGDAEIDAALLRGERLRKILPRAASARYDRKVHMIVVTFTNGAIISFPPALVQGFSTADAEQLADIRILRGGAGLHWEALDTDLAVAGLLNQVFGTRKALARLAGRVRSPAKATAARANGRKGGRPPKVMHAD